MVNNREESLLSRAVRGRPTLSQPDAFAAASVRAAPGRRRGSIHVVEKQRERRFSLMPNTRRETMLLVEDLTTDTSNDWACCGRQGWKREDDDETSDEEARSLQAETRSLGDPMRQASTASSVSLKAEDIDDVEDVPRFCGIDKRAFLPVGLFALLLIGVLTLVLAQYPLAKDLPGPAIGVVFSVCCFFYFICFFAMIVTTFSSPGTLSPQRYARIKNSNEDMPERSTFNKGYSTPVLRFDHYCRWVMNVIGLNNHRPFIIMLTSMAFCIVGSVILDLAFIIWILVARHGAVFQPDPTCLNLWRFVATGVHLIVYLPFGRYVLPLVKLHVGFVSRNELCKEWIDDKFQVVNGVRVLELDEATYIKQFDNFQYDGSLNKWDKETCCRNCMVFWCTPRWEKTQVGNF